VLLKKRIASGLPDEGRSRDGKTLAGHKKSPSSWLLEGLHPVFLALDGGAAFFLTQSLRQRVQGRSSGFPALSAAFPFRLCETVAHVADKVSLT
jgi:hypothetical protein